MPLATLLHLDRWVVMHVYFHPTNKDGSLRLRPKRDEEAAPLSERERHYRWAKQWPLDDWQEEQLWRQAVARHQTTATTAGPSSNGPRRG